MTLNPQNRGCIFWRFRAATHILRANRTEMAGDRPVQPEYKIFSIECRYIFNNLSFDVLNSRILPYGGLKFEYFFKTYYYFIACCTLIAKVAGPLLSRLTWALLKLLVTDCCQCLYAYSRTRKITLTSSQARASRSLVTYINFDINGSIQNLLLCLYKLCRLYA